MFPRTPSRFTQVATTTIAVLAMAGMAAAQDPAGLIFAQPGKLTAKLQKVGKIKGPVPDSTMEYGPRSGVPADGFRLIMNDGLDTLTLTGAYTFDGNRKIVLIPDPGSIASDLEDLIEFAADFPSGTINVDCVTASKTNKAKAKAKVKIKKGIVTSSTNVKIACTVSISDFPDTLSVKLGFKGKNGNQI